MIYKTYGKTGKRVSAVGFGGMRFDTSLPNEDNAQLLLYARDRGINYFDTAPGYCADKSEIIFGLALEQMASRRNEYYVSTKGSPQAFTTAQAAREAVEKSLTRLKVDKLDFYYVWCIRAMEHYHQAMKPGGQYEGLLQCKDQGLIDHIVLSTHLPGDLVAQIVQRGEFDGILLGVNILNFPFRWLGVKAAAEMEMGVAAMNPLSGGTIPKHEERLSFLGGPDETPTEAALRFCISCPEITITLNGFTTREHIDMACRMADRSRPFTDEDFQRVRSNVSEKMNEICTGCGYCLEHCSQQIPIAAYMLFYNQKQMFSQSDEEMAKELSTQHEWGFLVERQADADACIECGQCEQACTQHLNIIDRLREIAQWEKRLP